MSEARGECAVTRFKRTEVGDIPVDWVDTPIGVIAEVTSGGTPSRKVPPFWGGEIPWVTTAELDHGEVTEALQFITSAGLQNSAAKWLPSGTLLVALYGQGKTRGKCAVLRIDAATNQACAAIKLTSQVDSDFVRHNLSHRYEYIRGLSNGGSQENLSGAIVKQIRVGLPPTLIEQQAIARAISDADALIDSLEQLLAKKRQIKQGAMQELLTGKRRLPGFTKDWEKSRLGNMLSIKHGRSQRFVECDRGDYPILATGGQIGWANEYLHDKPSVLIGRKGTIDQPRYMDTPFWSVDTLFYSEVHSENVAKFLYYRFCLIDWMRHNEASGVPSLGAKVIESIEISCPVLEEQQAIADVLSDMDLNIATLESRLEKARALKQAMAQALLTGRIRLVDPIA